MLAKYLIVLSTPIWTQVGWKSIILTDDPAVFFSQAVGIPAWNTKLLHLKDIQQGTKLGA